MISSQSLFERFRTAEETISKGGRDFTLFGLFQRDDLPTKFDVVVSASWLVSDRNSLNLLIELVRQAIGDDDWWPRIGTFVVLPQEDPLVQAVLSRMPGGATRHEVRLLHNVPYEDEFIESAAIITAVRPAAEAWRPEPVAA